ncbi:MAG TPA: acyl-CoA dehydrogenase, partial [Rhodobiaceae bacterium]|nr:acyl-CoA dehydrogenase [Rhodobiaceae bacterium]
SYEMMNIFGVVSLGWMWAQMAKVALAKLAAGEGNADFYNRKLVLAKFWLEREVPNTAAYLERIELGSEDIMKLEEDAFVA